MRHHAHVCGVDHVQQRSAFYRLAKISGQPARTLLRSGFTHTDLIVVFDELEATATIPEKYPFQVGIVAVDHVWG